MSYGLENSSGSEEAFIEMALEEQAELLLEQIDQPINKFAINYFKIFVAEVEKEFSDSKAKQREFLIPFAKKTVSHIMAQYKHPETDEPLIELIAVDDDNIVEIADMLYRFFIKNSYANTELFMTQYILNQNNRKNLAEYFKDTKNSAYIRETYGSKQNYILANNVSNILSLLANTEIFMDDVIKYMTKSMDYPGHITKIDDLMKNQIIALSPVMIGNMISKVVASSYEGHLVNSICTTIYEKIIAPTIGPVSMFTDDKLVESSMITLKRV